MAKAVRANSEIAKLFLSLTGSRNLWQVWSDVIFLIAVSISNTLDTGPRKEEREKRYMEIIKNYSESERQVIVQISAAITEALDNKPDQDLLGGLFMELNLGNERGGQFFTPYNVCCAMASITAEVEIKEIIAENGYVKVNDCACGAGATLIAFANRIHDDLGINYQTDCMFVGQDIDYTTALMCYIQLSLLGCPGYIKIGDTLSDPALDNWTEIETKIDIWLTPMFYNEVWMARRISEQLAGLFSRLSVHTKTEKVQDKETVRTTDSSPEQISLF